MQYEWTLLKRIGFSLIILFVIFLSFIIVFQGYNQAKGDGEEIEGVVIEAIIQSSHYNSQSHMIVRTKLDSGIIVRENIPVHPGIKRGTRVIAKRYSRSVSGFEYRLFKYLSKDGFEIVKNPIKQQN